MSAIYDNWERLVAAVLKREQLWQLFHEDSRTPSILPEASSFSSSFGLGSFDVGNSSRFQKALPKLVLISDFSPAFGVDDLRLASAKLLGNGTFGSSYLAAMDNGVKIVMKRLKSVSISEEDFKRHMDIIGNVWHENVAPLRAYYSSKDEQLMLYDYYSKGSVYALLHGQTGESRAHLDWGTRLKIAIGASRGIAEIHKQSGAKLVHGNIKSSNIFINPQHYGCVSDLGLANMIETTFGPASWCYAPELKSTRNVSQASDVYGFGVVLLELLTRRSTEHLPGGPEPVDLVKWVGYVKSKEMATEIFDKRLLKHPSIKKDMKRPKMSEVVKMLDDIGKMNLVTYGFARMLFPHLNLRICYLLNLRAKLENGNTIVVMRLRDVPIAFKEFQQHMEVIGGMRHENIVELRAYYFSRHKRFLVYDYYNQGSVFAALHGTVELILLCLYILSIYQLFIIIEWVLSNFAGETSTGKKPLDWDTRLKIAVSAARGIAHIHRQDGYCAPDVMDTQKVSQASDIYSFGFVLLELLTGKPSQDKTDDGRVISLVDWIKSVLLDELTVEVFDVELFRYLHDKEAMLQVLQIALDCVAIIPEHRPAMPEIVKMLEEISGFNPSNESSLEDLLEDLLPTLTP
ncbi:Serine/threonine protein kinase [Handroanthus impetiginosus]|uniref:Serine/threonine protein kinase n=1 Tax=Handroanthus impetiginosus TaxID=429701 RepID=A0A2G9H5T0_9LAMI|nr:Serine/threonine protein kinase [Handroanthus impetiginosus]